MLWGLQNGHVAPYDDELIMSLREIYYGGIPASIVLLSNSMSNGHCYDRAVLLARAFLETTDDVKLIYASVDSLRLNPEYSGKKSADHCIVERITEDGRELIYDTSCGFVFDKKFYWKLERPKVRLVNDKDSIKKFVFYDDDCCIERDKYAALLILPMIEMEFGSPTEMYSRDGIELLQREIEHYKKTIDYDGVVKEIDADMKRIGLRKSGWFGMFKTIKKNLFFTRFNALFEKGVKDGKITLFDDEIFDKMSSTFISCLPVSMYIKHSKYLFDTGTCYERSLYMFLALDDALLVRGNDKYLEYRFGEGHGGHGWVEVDDYVYDPSLMLRFEKDFYYKLYGIDDVSKYDKSAYLELNHEVVDFSVSHDLNEFRPDGARRLELGVLIGQLKVLSSLVGDDCFAEDLNAYLALIDYDENQIKEQRNAILQKIFTDRIAMSRLSGNN